ncbi:MAG: VOC family protein, partial [Actinobacteria bacterium]|nr:VOC family protein [Actinomycetota bacterium]
MPIIGLNHAVLYVRDAELTAKFFIEVLDFTRVN